MKYFICYNIFIPLRAEPSERSEMTSQILFGEMVEELEKDHKLGFSHVRCLFDSYSGWCNTSSLSHAPDYIDTIPENTKCLITRDIITILRTNDNGPNIYLSAGSTVCYNIDRLVDVQGKLYHLPARCFRELKRSKQDKLLISARKFLHVPYLWGGRSTFGTDCSGFVQNVYKQSGIALPRDASQQANFGTTIRDFSELKKADLMFFENEQGAISHTGIYMGGGRIIHASGRVRIDQVDDQGILSADAGKYTHKLISVRRIIGG